MKILCIKDHVCSSINDFHQRIRAITNPQFCDRSFELKKNKEDDEQSRFLRITVAVYFTYFESNIVYRSTRRGCENA